LYSQILSTEPLLLYQSAICHTLATGFYSSL